MIRINLFSTSATRDSVAWGTKNFSSKKLNDKTATEKSGVLLFAAVLIVCSLAVGCSNDKPKPVNSLNQMSQTPTPIPDTTASSTAPAAQPVKPATKKVVKKRPATVTYADQTYGVTFDYPRRYAIETGDAANELVASGSLPMNFVTNGGSALAAVELPETGFANTDFSSAYFNVSVNKSVSADDCGKFSVPAPAASTPSDATTTDQAKSMEQSANSTMPNANPPAATSVKTDAMKTDAASSTQSVTAPNKLMLGDLEMQGAEAVSGEGNRQSDSKYFHVYQNGACYEFALNVNTVAAKTDASMKHVDRDKVFTRLEQILSTVKIAPIVAAAAASEVTASAPASPSAAPEASTTAPETPATPAASSSTAPSDAAAPTATAIPTPTDSASTSGATPATINNNQ
jgi:hypothetical protein